MIKQKLEPHCASAGIANVTKELFKSTEVVYMEFLCRLLSGKILDSSYKIVHRIDKANQSLIFRRSKKTNQFGTLYSTRMKTISELPYINWIITL